MSPFMTDDPQLDRLIALSSHTRIAGWLTVEEARYYVRINPRLVENQGMTCFVIANIETPEAAQGTGIFTRFLVAVRARTDLPFYIELVHNLRFARALEARGFRKVRNELGGGGDYFRMN